MALAELGADLTVTGDEPDGTNINDECGSTHPQLLQETVVASGADIGLALDGDADRLIVIDEKGRPVDGDQLMALIGLDQHRRGQLHRRRGPRPAQLAAEQRLHRGVGVEGALRRRAHHAVDRRQRLLDREELA